MFQTFKNGKISHIVHHYTQHIPLLLYVNKTAFFHCRGRVCTFFYLDVFFVLLTSQNRLYRPIRAHKDKVTNQRTLVLFSPAASYRKPEKIQTKFVKIFFHHTTLTQIENTYTHADILHTEMSTQLFKYNFVMKSFVLVRLKDVSSWWKVGTNVRCLTCLTETSDLRRFSFVLIFFFVIHMWIEILTLVGRW